MDAKDKRIAELEKQIASKDKVIANKDAQLEEAQNNVASPCGFLDVWKAKTEGKEDSANFKREYTYEWLIETAKLAQENDGIVGMRYQLQPASRPTPGTLYSYQVYLSHCVTYGDDNADKAERGIEYKNEHFSKNVAGRNYWKNPPKKQVAVASVN